MEWSKIKNIIILILLAVNAFLLVQTVSREYKSAAYAEEARTGVVMVLAEEGIRMDGAALPDESRLSPMRAERDRESERMMAEELLGPCEKTGDRGPVTYRSTQGEAQFLSDGKFSVLFSGGGPALNGAAPVQHAAKLLAGLGYSCEVVGEDVTAHTVTVRQTLDGTPLFNCLSVLTYEGERLQSIRGQRLIGTPGQEEPCRTLSVATVLLRFLSGARDGGHVFSEIHSLTAGYEVTGSATGTARLEPVWRVVTNTKTFTVDGTDGTVKPAAPT